VQSICDYLASPNGTCYISLNAYGCNSQQEVETACAAIGIESLPTNPVFSIFPNPTDSKMTIETTHNGHLSIFNLSGQQILQQEITEPITTIDLSTLLSGVYFVRVMGEWTVEVGKVIKE
jgi:hypothetical protein